MSDDNGDACDDARHTCLEPQMCTMWQLTRAVSVMIMATRDTCYGVMMQGTREGVMMQGTLDTC